MRRAVVVVGVMLPFLGIPASIAGAERDPARNVPQATKPSDQCSRYGRTTACGDSNTSSVVLNGGKQTGTASSSGGHGAGGAVVEPAGTVQLVACGGKAAGQLSTLGDPDGALDAHSSCASTPICDQTTQATGVLHRQYVRVVKQSDGTWSLTGATCNAVTNAPPRVTAMMVWQQAQRLIPSAAIGLAPRTTTLVNIQTVMWVDTLRERDLPVVTILGQPVAIHVTVTGVAWDYGDDETNPDGPIGKPYDGKHDPCRTKQCPGYDGHTYSTTGHMTITATVSWHASFRVNGGPVVAIPGALNGPAAATDVLVREARGVLVPDPTST